MKKSKILISAVTMFSLCITPMSVYAQVDPNSNIENTISQTKSAENLPTPVLQEKEIEVSNGTGSGTSVSPVYSMSGSSSK